MVRLHRDLLLLLLQAWLKRTYRNGGSSEGVDESLVAGSDGLVDSCQLWVGHGGSSTPCHFDALDNFLAQMVGRKRVLLLPPKHAFDLSPYPVGHIADNFAMADLERPDLACFPALARVRGVEAVLCPGDVLWLPQYHWHLVQQLDAGHENVSLSIWLGDKGNDSFMSEARADQTPPPPSISLGDYPGDLRADDQALVALLLDEEGALRAFRVGRLVETIAARVTGSVVGGGEFLTALAAGEDRGWDPASKATKVAARIRGQIARLLRFRCHPDALLRAITCDGRLFPGPLETNDSAISSDAVRGVR